MPVTDPDLLSGCDVLHAEPLESPLYDTPEVESWRALFPGGLEDAPLADAWKALSEVHTVEDALARATTETPRAQARGPLGAAAAGRDLGIADRLRAAGLAVVEIAGWQTRGAATFNPRGSICHHTAGPRSGNAPSLNICINGRSDLPGPLCQVVMGRDNTCYVIASGRANHAGTGGYNGLAGNSSVYGIEHENVGTSAEPWRPDQFDAMAKAHAALLRGRAGADMLCMHKEWTTRKPDAHSLRGSDLRALTAKYLAGGTPAPAPTPTPKETEMSAPAVVSWGPGRLDIFYRGKDNRIWQRWFDGDQGGWNDLGGWATSGPAAVSWGANRIDVFARGTGDALFHKWWDGEKWSVWESLGGVLTSAPTATSIGPDRLHVLGRGTNGKLWQRVWDGKTWSPWADLGGDLA